MEAQLVVLLVGERHPMEPDLNRRCQIEGNGCLLADDWQQQGRDWIFLWQQDFWQVRHYREGP
jgi:hypothetical protein